jgi:SAM-dependent methyltransferase
MSTFGTILKERMTGQRDVELVQRLSNEMPQGTQFIECGPWLGYLSRIMARNGPVFALDTFVWTNDHFKRVPNVHELGDSFRDTFDTCNSDTPHPITSVEGDFAKFDWNGPPFGFCLIDAPKTADKLAVVLKSVLPHLTPDAVIVIINGRYLKYVSMVGLITRAVEAGVLRWRGETVNAESRSAVLLRGDINGAAAILDRLVDAPVVQFSVGALPDTDNTIALASIMAGCVKQGQWSEAYQLLARTENEPGFQVLWEEVEASLDLTKLAPERLGNFSHMVDALHSAAVNRRPPKSIHKSATNAVEEFWFRNADKPWRAAAFNPEIISRAQEMGYMVWPSEIAGRLEGKRVLDVGCGFGLHGIGVLASGAVCYHGVDPTLELGSSKVKDLVTKGKACFGYTPEYLMAQMSPFELSAAAIEDVAAPDEPYDVALMHMVTQHLAELEGAIAATSRLLAPGGALILQHRNFLAWNGHQIAPNTVDAIDQGNPAHMELVDWRHLSFDPPHHHYIARKLNRVSLAELRRSLELYFEIDIWLPKSSTPAQGLGRLNDEIRARHPEHSDDDLETQTVFCVAKRR